MSLSSQARSVMPESRWQYAAAVALIGLAALIASWYYKSQGEVDASDVQIGTITTASGEHRCEKLPDGSDVCLNTRSTVRYAVGRSRRNVELVSGEATFVVQKDHRPFDVLSGRVLIHGVSTAFDVYKRSDSTLVTVVDGRVQIVAPKAWYRFSTAPELHRLQQIEFDESTGTLHIRPTLTENGLSQVLAWQRGRIDLTGMRLEDALQEFSRYQPIERFHFQDESLRELQMGGELESTNLMDFLDSLTTLFGIRYTLTRDPDGQTTVNLSRRQTDPKRRGS